MNRFPALRRLVQASVVVCSVLAPLSFVQAQQAPNSGPAPASTKCRFTCISDVNIYTDAPGASGTCTATCTGKRFTNHPETESGAPACNGTPGGASASCTTACNSVCGGADKCFMGSSALPALPDCARSSTVPSGCASISDVSAVIAPNMSQYSEPRCVALSTDNPRTGAPAGSSAALFNPLGTGTVTIPDIIKRILNTVLGIIGALALLMFVYGGIRWITSGGNDEGVKLAQMTIKNATIGLLLIFFSYIIITAFLSAFAPGT